MSAVHFELAMQTTQGAVLTRHCLPAPATVLQALAAAQVAANGLKIGVWSRPIQTGQMLQNGDRIECYLPLRADPKDARRARVNRSLTAQATKQNAANRANNRAHRARREAEQGLKTLD